MPRRLLSLAAVLAAAPATAQVANRLANPDFSGGIGGWSTAAAGGGTAQYDFYFGSPGSGALALYAAGSGRSAHAEQCVGVADLFTADFSLRALKSTEYGSGSHAFVVALFDGDGCSGTLQQQVAALASGQTFAGADGLTWSGFDALGLALPPGARSARVTVDVAGGGSGGASWIVDHVQFGRPDTLFRDGFDPP